MQSLQYDLRCPSAKDNSIAHAAAAPSSLDAAITMRYSNIELQNTIELRTTAWEIAAPKPDISGPKQKKHDFEALFKGILYGKSLAPKLRKSADKSQSQPWCSHSNTICNVQLQKTILLCMQPRHQATLMQPLHCDLQAQISKDPIEQRHVAEHQGRTNATLKRSQPHPPHTHTHTNTHTRYPSSLAAGTLHGKTQGFVLRLPPQNKPHATFMQPLQPVTTLHHHHFDTLRQMYCCVMYSDVMYCCVMYCCVMYCWMMYCYVMYCYVM